MFCLGFKDSSHIKKHTLTLEFIVYLAGLLWQKPEHWVICLFGTHIKERVCIFLVKISIKPTARSSWLIDSVVECSASSYIKKTTLQCFWLIQWLSVPLPVIFILKNNRKLCDVFDWFSGWVFHFQLYNIKKKCNVFTISDTIHVIVNCNAVTYSTLINVKLCMMVVAANCLCLLLMLALPIHTTFTDLWSVDDSPRSQLHPTVGKNQKGA